MFDLTVNVQTNHYGLRTQHLPKFLIARSQYFSISPQNFFSPQKK